MPFTQMFLLGYGVTLDLKHIPVCAFDREASQNSQALLKHFEASAYFAIARNVASYPALVRAIDRGDCKLAIVIPPDFSQRLNDTGSASVQAILDATDDNTANIALRLCARRRLRLFERNDNSTPLDRQGRQFQQIQPMTVQSRVWFNEDLESRNFIIPGVVAVIMALVGAQLTSLTISREWERGTMELLISTPVQPSEVMVGKLAPYLRFGWIDAGVLPGPRDVVVRRAVPRHAFYPVRHHDAVPDRRARDRLSAVGPDPQPDRRQPDRACC